MASVQKLIARVRVVWMIVRAVESAAVGGLIAAGAALLLVGVQAWLGEPSLALASGLLAVGVVLGATASLVRVPSRLAVAQRIDRQFGLHDLLSTALNLASRDHDIDAMVRQVVLLQASAAAGRIPVTGVSFARLSARAYTAAAIAMAMVLTVSAIAAPESRPGATSQAGATRSAATPAGSLPRASAAAANAGPMSRSPERERGVIDERAPDPTSPDAAAGDRAGGETISNEVAANSSAAAGSTARQGRVDAMRNAPAGAGELSNHGIAGPGRRGAQDSGDVSAAGEVADGTPAPAEQPFAPATPADMAPGARSPASVPPAYRTMVRRFFARE